MGTRPLSVSIIVPSAIQLTLPVSGDSRVELERRLRCSEKIRRDEFPLEPGDDFSTFGRRRITGHDRTLLAGKRLDFFRNMLAMIH